METHQNLSVPVSIRLNPFKKSDITFPFKGEVPWCEGGYYLKERPLFTADPLFHAGCYYVQEASSMFLSSIFKQTVSADNDLTVLDTCASPGGKSTLVSSFLNNKSVLVANDVIKGRAETLAYNLAKWGKCNHIVTNNDTNVFSDLNEMFDVILVDAPCSGSGLFRKQPEAIHEWSLQHVEQCSVRQYKIIENVYPALKEGGLLIYSTCSYSEAENEEVVKRLIKEFTLEIVKIKVPPEWGIDESEIGYRFYPYQLEGEGFFCSVLRKTEKSPYKAFKTLGPIKQATKETLKQLENFIKVDDDLQILEHASGLKLASRKLSDTWKKLSVKTYVKQAGTPIGELKHGNLVPHHSLALSVYLHPKLLKLELNNDNAIRYLKKENLTLNGSSEGLKLVSYQGFGIGWAKVLSNRINNYLPNEATILNKEIGN